METEVSRLTELLQKKTAECDDWIRKYKALEFTREQEADEHRRSLSNAQGVGFVRFLLHCVILTFTIGRRENSDTI